MIGDIDHINMIKNNTGDKIKQCNVATSLSICYFYTAYFDPLPRWSPSSFEVNSGDTKELIPERKGE
jgi:hypothetical protein